MQFCWQIPCTSQFIFFICHVTAPWFRELFLFITRLWSITTNFSFTIYYFEERQGTGHCFSNCYSTKTKQYFSKGYSKLNSTLYIKIYHYECNSKLAGYSFTPSIYLHDIYVIRNESYPQYCFPAFLNRKNSLLWKQTQKTSTVSKIKIFHCVCLGVAINLNWFFLPLSWNSDSYTARPSYLFVYEASCFGDFLPCEKGNREEQTITTETKNSTVHVKKKSWFIKNWTKFTTDPLPLTSPSLQLKHSYINIPVIVKYFTVTYRQTSSATAVLGTSQSLTGLWYLWQEVGLWHQR